MKLSAAITMLHANIDTYKVDIDIKDISTSELAELASAIQQNKTASFLRFLDGNLNAETAKVITEALRQNFTVQKIIGIESSEISELLVRNRYFAAKKQLIDRCNRNIYLKEIGPRIIAHIEQLKSDHPTKIAIFTKAMNKLYDFVQFKPYIINIDQFLVELKTNIDSDDYKQLRARIYVFLGLCIMFASIYAITFYVITGSTLLIPAAAIGLSYLLPILVGRAMIIDEAGIYKAWANGQLMHYFFTRTTPEREDDRQVLDILKPCASSAFR
jgi:hypothetical protein